MIAASRAHAIQGVKAAVFQKRGPMAAKSVVEIPRFRPGHDDSPSAHWTEALVLSTGMRAEH
jgi:hypothetical protein